MAMQGPGSPGPSVAILAGKGSKLAELLQGPLDEPGGGGDTTFGAEHTGDGMGTEEAHAPRGAIGFQLGNETSKLGDFYIAE